MTFTMGDIDNIMAQNGLDKDQMRQVVSAVTSEIIGASDTGESVSAVLRKKELVKKLAIQAGIDASRAERVLSQFASIMTDRKVA